MVVASGPQVLGVTRHRHPPRSTSRSCIPTTSRASLTWRRRTSASTGSPPSTWKSRYWGLGFWDSTEMMPRVPVPPGRATPGWLFLHLLAAQQLECWQRSWIWEPRLPWQLGAPPHTHPLLLPSPGPSPPLSIPRFGFYKYMKMDEEEEDPRQRAFLFLGPDSESPASLGTGPSSRHPRWRLIPSELWLIGMAPGGQGCAEQHPSEHPSRHPAWRGHRAMWDVAGHWSGICSPSHVSWVGLGSGQQETDPVWSLGMSMEPGAAPGGPEAVQSLPRSVCSLAKPWQVGFAPG